MALNGSSASISIPSMVTVSLLAGSGSVSEIVIKDLYHDAPKQREITLDKLHVTC